MDKEAQALVYRAPCEAAIEDVALGAGSGDSVDVRTLYSGLSRGTERLVFEGRVPQAEWNRMRAPFQQGAFPFPVRYGYAAVGEVVAGPDALLGRTVFCLHPHQNLFRVPAGAVTVLPDGLPAPRAVLAANMETALNALWDANPAPGMRCLVVGAGLVGWLVTALLSCRKDLDVHLTDISPETGVNADDFRVTFVSPEDVPAQSFDLAIHTSASSSGLQTALDALAFEGRVLDLSWYGDTPVTVSLGGNFHANRLSIQSSQVGHIAPRRRAAYSYRRRMERALGALQDPRLDALITEEIRFRDVPDAMSRLLAHDATGIATRIAYP